MGIKQLENNKNQLLILLNGEMDAQGCKHILPELEKVSEQLHSHVIVDINDVSFIDSSGIGAIVFLFKRLKAQNRTLEIIGVQGQPKELMKLLRMDSAIPMQYLAASEEALCAQ